MHALVDLHGENSTAAKEAKQLLNDVIIRLNNAFVRAYQGKALVSVIVSDASHTRRTRSILAAKAEAAADVTTTCSNKTCCFVTNFYFSGLFESSKIVHQRLPSNF